MQQSLPLWYRQWIHPFCLTSRHSFPVTSFLRSLWLFHGKRLATLDPHTGIQHSSGPPLWLLLAGEGLGASLLPLPRGGAARDVHPGHWDQCSPVLDGWKHRGGQMSEVIHCARTQGERRRRGEMVLISHQPAVARCNAGEDTRRAHTWCACPQPGGFAPASHKNHVCTLCFHQPTAPDHQGRSTFLSEAQGEYPDTGGEVLVEVLAAWWVLLAERSCWAESTYRGSLSVAFLPYFVPPPFSLRTLQREISVCFRQQPTSTSASWRARDSQLFIWCV